MDEADCWAGRSREWFQFKGLTRAVTDELESHSLKVLTARLEFKFCVIHFYVTLCQIYFGNMLIDIIWVVWAVESYDQNRTY